MLEASASAHRAAARPGVRAAPQSGGAWLTNVAAAVARSGRHQRPGPILVISFVLVAAWLANGTALAPGAARSARSVSDAPKTRVTEALAGSSREGSALGQVLGGRFAGIADSLSRGPFLADGTLIKPLLAEGAVPGSMRVPVTIYTVRPGDTLTGIAARFGVSMMTVWWANNLRSKDLLHVGQQLRIPPVSGLLYTVREGDTLDSIALLTRADARAIRDFNGLTSGTLLIGQLLMIPDGLGRPIPTPVPTAQPAAAATAPPVVQPLATMTGVASWMYGSGTAARLPLDTLLRICGEGGCIERRVTSWGPATLDRIVDLSVADFPIVCGCSLSTGLTVVRIDILPS